MGVSGQLRRTRGTPHVRMSERGEWVLGRSILCAGHMVSRACAACTRGQDRELTCYYGYNRGQYSDAVLSELENQNDNELEGISAKVKMLKDVRLSYPPPTSIPTCSANTLLQLTVSIGDEIRSSSSLADAMNDSFDNTRVRLRGTMNRMLRMAEKTGVGWKVWVGFFLAVWLIFVYVWLF